MQAPGPPQTPLHWDLQGEQTPQAILRTFVKRFPIRYQTAWACSAWQVLVVSRCVVCSQAPQCVVHAPSCAHSPECTPPSTHTVYLNSLGFANTTI